MMQFRKQLYSPVSFWRPGVATSETWAPAATGRTAARSAAGRRVSIREACAQQHRFCPSAVLQSSPQARQMRHAVAG